MVDAMVTSYLLDNLMEDTDYIIRIIARNREGESQPLVSESISVLRPSSKCYDDVYCSLLQVINSYVSQ